MDEIMKCLCGAEPIVEQKSDERSNELFKYRCPNCEQKELPWIRQWDDCGALQEWNRIAQKRSYHKRTLEYNDSGVCIAEPYKVYECSAKKYKLTVEIYLDNSMYYYALDYSYVNSGGGFGLWIGAKCFPSLDLVKYHALKDIIRHEKELRKIAEKLLKTEIVQMELF